LKDKVIVDIFFGLTTHEISMQYAPDMSVKTWHRLRLPAPDPNSFIPYDKVDERTILKWLDENYRQHIIVLQHNNTIELCKKYNLRPEL
jgi:hypothetical protein